MVDPGDDQVGPLADQAELGEAHAVDRRAVGGVAAVAVAELDLLDRQRRAGRDAARGGAAVGVGRDHVDLDAVDLAQGAAGGLQAGGGDAVVVGEQDSHGSDSRRRGGHPRRRVGDAVAPAPTSRRAYGRDDFEYPPVREVPPASHHGRCILLPVPTVRLDLEYDGSGFRGWAAQPGLRTVQGELEAALETVLREAVQLTVAGRTDTGVHALGQVASFETEAEVPGDLARRFNGVGPDDIAVTTAAVVADGFDARRDARSRSYRYRVLARRTPSPFEQGRALWWPHRVDRDALDACAAALTGTHDFTAFTPTQTDHVRFDRDVLPAAWTAEGDILSFRITADAFMRNMVRALVGTMLEAASGGRTVEDFNELLRARPAPPPATPHPPTASTWSQSATTRRVRLWVMEAGFPLERADTQSDALISASFVGAGGNPASPTPARGRPSQSSPTGADPA